MSSFDDKKRVRKRVSIFPQYDIITVFNVFIYKKVFLWLFTYYHISHDGMRNLLFFPCQNDPYTQWVNFIHHKKAIVVETAEETRWEKRWQQLLCMHTFSSFQLRFFYFIYIYFKWQYLVYCILEKSVEMLNWLHFNWKFVWILPNYMIIFLRCSCIMT